MIPIGDDNTCRRGNAVVNWILIGLNILVFIFLQKFGLDDYVTPYFSSWHKGVGEIIPFSANWREYFLEIFEEINSRPLCAN
jgi:hypothetical protein